MHAGTCWQLGTVVEQTLALATREGNGVHDLSHYPDGTEAQAGECLDGERAEGVASAAVARLVCALFGAVCGARRVHGLFGAVCGECRMAWGPGSTCEEVLPASMRV